MELLDGKNLYHLLGGGKESSGVKLSEQLQFKLALDIAMGTPDFTEIHAETNFGSYRDGTFARLFSADLSQGS